MKILPSQISKWFRKGSTSVYDDARRNRIALEQKDAMEQLEQMGMIRTNLLHSMTGSTGISQGHVTTTTTQQVGQTLGSSITGTAVYPYGQQQHVAINPPIYNVNNDGLGMADLSLTVHKATNGFIIRVRLNTLPTNTITYTSEPENLMDMIVAAVSHAKLVEKP